MAALSSHRCEFIQILTTKRNRFHCFLRTSQELFEAWKTVHLFLKIKYQYIDAQKNHNIRIVSALRQLQCLLSDLFLYLPALRVIFFYRVQIVIENKPKIFTKTAFFLVYIQAFLTSCYHLTYKTLLDIIHIPFGRQLI